MKLPRLALRPIQNAFLGPEACIWCHTRQFLDRPTRRFVARRPLKAPSTKKRESRERLRKSPLVPREEIEQQAAQRYMRILQGALQNASAQRIISMSARDAEMLLWDYRSCDLETLRDRYDLPLEAYSPLANLLLRIPDPSLHNLGRRLLIECSLSNDTYATITLMASVRFYAKTKNHWTQGLPFDKISIARRNLQRLAYELEIPDAMVLVGLDLRDEKNDPAARLLFESAMRKISGGEAFDLNSGKKKDMLAFILDDIRGQLPLPMPAPWIALGNLLLEQAEPDLEAAKAVFRIGAEKADDPLAYFYLAECGDMYSDDWLEYMTKAAASGHSDAMVYIGNYYLHDRKELDEMIGPKGRRALRQLDSFTAWRLKGLRKENMYLPSDITFSGREGMAFEWYWLSGGSGRHKPGMLALAKLLRRKAAWLASAQCLKEMLENQNVEATEDVAAMREARAWGKVWQEEERREGLTFTRDALDSLRKK